jgi:hypothetical protein
MCPTRNHEEPQTGGLVSAGPLFPNQRNQHMKKTLPLALLAVVLFATATPAVTYTAADILRNAQNVNQNSKYNNPLYLWAYQVDDLLLNHQAGPGHTFYVNSNVATAGSGTSWDTAVATIDAAYNLCTTSRGDTIYVAAGHAESWTATGLTCDLIGVTILGLGTGSNAPTISYTGASGLLSMTGAANRISGIRFLPHVTSITKAINITGDDCVVDHCTFLPGEDGSAVDEFTDTIINATGADRTVIFANTFRTQRGDASASGVKLSNTSVGAVVVGNTFLGAYSAAAIYGITAASTSVQIADNVGADVTLYTGTTGQIERNAYPTPDFISKQLGAKVGNIYYVNGGSDGPVDNYGSGTSPGDPKQTITAALAKCVSGQGDYIFVCNYGGNARAVETWPIAMTKDQVHLMGLHATHGSKWATVTATGTNANAITVTGARCEIANLEIGGTAAGSGCAIAVGNLAGVWGLYVHDCWFGVADGAGTNGILVGSTFDAPYLTVENCVFGNGLLGTAILFNGVATKFNVSNNLFLSCTLGINVAGSCVGGKIINNQFCLDADTNGDAITLAAGSSLIWCNGNVAHYGKSAMSNKPYTDGSSTNTWGMNYKDIVPALPGT